MSFLASLMERVKKPQLKQKPLTKTHINGKKVVLETVLTQKLVGSDGNEMEKFREYTLEDGSTV